MDTASQNACAQTDLLCEAVVRAQHLIGRLVARHVLATVDLRTPASNNNSSSNTEQTRRHTTTTTTTKRQARRAAYESSDERAVAIRHAAFDGPKHDTTR